MIMVYSNRKKSLQNSELSLSRRKKKRIEHILSLGIDYVSSEDSGEEGDLTLHRRVLPWMKKIPQGAT